VHLDDNSAIVFDPARCHSCHDGVSPRQIKCRTCRGTGNGVRGGRGGCRTCHGSGHGYDAKDLVTCRYCDGTGYRGSEDTCSAMPHGFLDALGVTYEVVRQDRAELMAERLFGLGFYSCGDYGDAWKANDDDALIAKVRESLNTGYTQLTKLLADHRDVSTLSRRVVILVHRQGYSVVADHR
jgi:hypothetical protein